MHLIRLVAAFSLGLDRVAVAVEVQVGTLGAQAGVVAAEREADGLLVLAFFLVCVCLHQHLLLAACWPLGEGRGRRVVNGGLGLR